MMDIDLFPRETEGILTCGKAAGIKEKRRSCARKEASAQEVRGYFKQIAEAKHLEYKSQLDTEVFDLVDLRKIKPRNDLTGRWVPEDGCSPSIRTNKVTSLRQKQDGH